MNQKEDDFYIWSFNFGDTIYSMINKMTDLYGFVLSEVPGGFIKYNEDPEQAVIREVREETNLAVEVIDKIGTYNQKGRDPREKRVESKAFKCRIVKDLSKLKGGDDATVAEAISVNEIKKMDLAFDHKKILRDAGIFK